MLGEERTPMPQLEEWIAEVGEEEVAATVRAAVADIADGTTPGFTDQEAFAAYMARRRHRPAS